MSLVDELKATVAEKYPDFSITAVGSTWHSNVVLLTKGDKKYVAKSVWFDSEDAADEARAQAAFDTEVAILRRLPAYWGIKYIDSFISPSRLNRIIVTTQFINCPWSELKPANYERIARSIVSQINWLHENNISHGDLELKNILLACDQSRAVIIDFEKSKQDTSAENKARDKETLLAAIRRLLPGFEATMTSMLSGRVRRASFGGTRRTLHKKKHKRKIRKTQKHKGKHNHE